MRKSILIILTLSGFASGAEMEVTDRLSVDGASLFKNTAVFSGNVGIGTTVPGYLLNVGKTDSGTGLALNPVLTLSNLQYTVGTGASLGFEFTTGVLGAVITGISSQSSGGGSLAFTTRSNTGAAGERMRIDGPTGNVGIGTASPVTALDVNGSMRLALNSAAPYTCDASHNGILAATNMYTACVCRNGTGWVSINDGATACFWGCTAGTTVVILTVTGATTWTVPSCWNNGNNTIETVGGGASGGAAGASNYGMGGGGGAYSKSSNVSLTAGAVVGVNVGTGGDAISNTGSGIPGHKGGDTWICNATINCASLAGSAVVSGAQGGTGGGNDANTGGAGGSASSGVGTTKYSGGSGGIRSINSGGGGAAGPNGAGIAGDTGSAAGGSGDAGSGGSGGAAGGGAGGNGTEWSASYGSGGGGGGAGNGNNAATAGNGGNYGGGGGGASAGGFNTGLSGAGRQGIIVITYTN